MNPRPKTHPSELLRAQAVILASAVSLGHRQAVTRCGFGSFMVHGALKALRAHVLHSSTPHPRPLTSGVERSLLKQRQEQRNRCSLIYKMPVLWMSGASARYSDFRVPVETGTPPRRRGSRVIRGAAVAKGARRTPHTLTSLLLSKRDPLRWAPIWGTFEMVPGHFKKGDCRFASRTAPERPHTPQTYKGKFPTYMPPEI